MAQNLRTPTLPPQIRGGDHAKIFPPPLIEGRVGGLRKPCKIENSRPTLRVEREFFKLRDCASRPLLDVRRKKCDAFFHPDSRERTRSCFYDIRGISHIFLDR